MSSSSVGSPEFDFDGAARAPDIEFVEPNPERRSFLAPLGLGLAAVAVTLFVLAGSPDTAPQTPPSEGSPPSTSALGLQPDELFLEQQELGRLKYTSRTIGENSPEFATETPEGFFGLRRGSGGWVPMTSNEGIDWTTDFESPIVGVPEGFRPGARRWSPDALQYVDGMFWGRFVSRRLAGSSGAMLMMKSVDGITWENIDGVPGNIDSARFNGTVFSRPGDFILRGNNVVAPNPLNEPVLFQVPDVDSDSWEIIDSAAGSNGAAILFFNEENFSYRLAVSSDAQNWSTIGLEEQGLAAIEIVLVGTRSVVLRASELFIETTELIVPLPLPVPERRFDLWLVDLVISQLTPIDDVYGGFIAGATTGDEVGGADEAIDLTFIRSDNGFDWDRRNGHQVDGIPSGSDPKGLWQMRDGSLLGAFTDPTGTELFYASSPTGVSWNVGPSFGADGQLRPGFVDATADAALISVVQRIPDGGASVEYYVLSNDLERIETRLDLRPSESVQSIVALDEATLVVVNTAGADPLFEQDLRLLVDGVLTPVIDLDFADAPIEAIVMPSLEELVALTTDGVFSTPFADPIGGDPLWRKVGSIASEDRVDTIEVREIQVGRNGAAALLIETDRPDRFIVAVTRDYRSWTSIVISNEGSNVHIDAVGDDEVILSGFVSAPYRVTVQMP
jgi:hypothetical protein